jgi:hypothetical protein
MVGIIYVIGIYVKDLLRISIYWDRFVVMDRNNDDR